MSIVPRSLATTDNILHSTEKAQLVYLETTNIHIPSKLPPNEVKSCLLMDGAALIQVMGKPDKAKTSGDLADIFSTVILNCFGTTYSRIDVLFDKYRETSLKSGTRKKRVGMARPIRRVISSHNSILPANWKSFICLSENKADLATFLSKALVTRTKEDLPKGQEVVVTGGFDDILDVWTSSPRNDEYL